MVFIDINEYIDSLAISEYDLLIVDTIYNFNLVSNKYSNSNIKICLFQNIINNLVYQKKVINDIDEKIAILDIIVLKYSNFNLSFLLKKFLNNKNNPTLLNKSDILRNISNLYNQYLKTKKITDYTTRLKEIIDSEIYNEFNKIILFGDFYNVSELEWCLIKKYLKNCSDLKIISNFKEEIKKVFEDNKYFFIKRNQKELIGFHPFAKFICNLIKINVNSFSDIKKLLQQNFISLKEMKINDDEEIVFDGEILNFEQENDLDLIEILNNIQKAGVEDITNKENVIKQIENYFYLRKQYAMDNEISEQKYEKDFYRTVLGWKILRQIIFKINNVIKNNYTFTQLYEKITKLINFLGIENYYQNKKIYKEVLQILYNIVYIFDRSDYIFDNYRLYLYLKAILENTYIEDENFYIKKSDTLISIQKLTDYYKKNNNYYTWSEYEGYLLGVKNDTIKDFYTSVTQIEEFSICPMKYFFNRKLKIRTNLLIDNDVDPILKGNLLHKILEKFYTKLSQDNYLNKDTNLLSDYCKSLIVNISNEFFEPYNNIMDNLYLQKVKNELLDGLNENIYKKGILYKVLEKDNNRIKQGWIPSKFEKKFVIEINDLKFSGSIDRVDINDKNEFEIIDYKTGNVFLNYKKAEIVSGLSFQLPIYTIAYEKESGKTFHSASYFVLKENDYLDITIYPIINKSNYKFLINKTLSNLDKLKNRLFYSKYNYTIENIERVCKSCDYKYICRINPLKSYYITSKNYRIKKIFNFIKNQDTNINQKIEDFVSSLKNKKILVTTHLFNKTNQDNNIFYFKNEREFLISFFEIEEFFDENRNEYLITKYIQETIDSISYKKDKNLELLLKILDRKQIIEFVSSIIKSENIYFYINNNFEDIWKIYTKKYLNYCEFAINKITHIQEKVKDIPLINKDIQEYIYKLNDTIDKIVKFINLFKLDRNNFNYSLDIKKSEYPIYSRNISSYINVSLHGEIVNTIYFGEYSLINILSKFEYFSIEKEYLKAFYKIINEVSKIIYDWKQKNNIFLYNDFLDKQDIKTTKNKILSKFDLIIKDSLEKSLNKFIFKNEVNKDTLMILNKQNNEYKILKEFELEKELKVNFVITKRKMEELLIIPDIIYQVKKEENNNTICLITNDDNKIKILTELFSKKKIKYLLSGFNLLNFQEVVDILNVLEFINNKQKYIELIGILRSPIFCLNDTEINNIACNTDDILTSLKNLYPDIYDKIENWINLSAHLKISELIQVIIEESKIREYINLDVNSYSKNSNINRLIEIACKNDDCLLSEFIDIIKNCKYSNYMYLNNPDYINIMTFEEARYNIFDTLIYLDTDEIFSNVNENILIDKINNNIVIGFDIPLQKSNFSTPSLTKMMLKENYEDKLLKKINNHIRNINKITNNILIFIMNYKTINNKLFSRFCEINSENVNKIFT